MNPEIRDELLHLVKAARAYLEIERECGGHGLALDLHRSEAGAAPGSPRTPPERSAATSGPAPRPDRSAPSAAPGADATSAAPRAPALLADAVSMPSTASAEPAATPSQPEAASPEDRLRRLELLAQDAAACKGCVLHEQRQHSVFARGSHVAELAFVGEGPGRDEDLQGFPFVGAAGQLLDKMIVAMGYGRDEVYVCNVVKCRPPENRTPRPEEMLACSRFLVPQLETLAPRMIVALGRCAAQALGVAEVTGPWRGRFGAWRGIPVMPTYHPAFLLRSPEFKRVVWDDLQQVMGRLGRTRPGT